MWKFLPLTFREERRFRGESGWVAQGKWWRHDRRDKGKQKGYIHKNGQMHTGKHFTHTTGQGWRQVSTCVFSCWNKFKYSLHAKESERDLTKREGGQLALHYKQCGTSAVCVSCLQSSFQMFQGKSQKLTWAFTLIIQSALTVHWLQLVHVVGLNMEARWLWKPNVRTCSWEISEPWK